MSRQSTSPVVPALALLALGSTLLWARWARRETALSDRTRQRLG